MSRESPTTSAAPLSALVEAPPDERGPFVPLLTRDSLMEAELIKSQLEAHDLEVRLTDDATVGLAPHLAGALGGVGVEVRESELEQARSLLATSSLGVAGPTFRVVATQRATGVLVGAFVGAGAAMALSWVLPAVVGALSGAGLVAAGFVFGARRRRDYCSTLGCAHLLGPDDVVCPGCGGAIVGELAHASERLAAEEAYKRARRAGDDDD